MHVLLSRETCSTKSKSDVTMGSLQDHFSSAIAESLSGGELATTSQIKLGGEIVVVRG